MCIQINEKMTQLKVINKNDFSEKFCKKKDENKKNSKIKSCILTKKKVEKQIVNNSSFKIKRG